MSIIHDVFKPIYGKPCWQVKQGYGSFITFEFGEPHLHIREPRRASNQATEKIRELAARRLVFVHGDWHLWVYICDWRIFLDGQETANNTSNRKTIKKALSELDGQALKSVAINKSYVTILKFDLGGKMEISPQYDEREATDELWLLYEPSGNVFTLRADGKYCRAPEDGSKDKWRPLAVSKPKVRVK